MGRCWNWVRCTCIQPCTTSSSHGTVQPNTISITDIAGTSSNPFETVQFNPSNVADTPSTSSNLPETVQSNVSNITDTSSTSSNPPEAVQFKAKDIWDLKKILQYIDVAIKEYREESNKKAVVPELVKENFEDAAKVLDLVTTSLSDFSSDKNPLRSIAEESHIQLLKILRAAGNVHWAAAGFSLLAFALSRADKMKANKKECLDILEALRTLGHHLVSLFPNLVDQDEKLHQATTLIFEGVLFCRKQLDDSVLKRFAFVNINENRSKILRDRIKDLYPDLSLAVLEDMLPRAINIEQNTKPLPSYKAGYPEDTVGLEEKVSQVLKILGMSDDGTMETGVRAVLLHGMGGIGKTTLGKAICARLPFTDRSVAQEEIGQDANMETIRRCQNNILERLSGVKRTIGGCGEGRDELESLLRNFRAPILLFIDNVFEMGDLEELLPKTLVLPDRSRIIVTSRIETVSTVLEEKGIECKIYPVQQLEDSQARELLYKHLETPPSDRESAVKSVLNICGGVPLALQVIGSHLRSKKNDLHAWDSTVDRLRRFFPISGMKKDKLNSSLRFSYEQLDARYQKAFVDISCLLRNFDWEWVESAGYRRELEVLQELSMVKKNTEFGGSREASRKFLLANYQSRLRENGWSSSFVQYMQSRETKAYGSKSRVQLHDLFVALGEHEQSQSNFATRIWSHNENMLPDPLGDDAEDLCEGVEGLVVRNCSSPIPSEKLDAMQKVLRILILEGVTVRGKCTQVPPRLQFCSTPDGFPYVQLPFLKELRVLDIGNHIDFDFADVKV